MYTIWSTSTQVLVCYLLSSIIIIIESKHLLDLIHFNKLFMYSANIAVDTFNINTGKKHLLGNRYNSRVLSTYEGKKNCVNITINT